MGLLWPDAPRPTLTPSVLPSRTSGCPHQTKRLDLRPSRSQCFLRLKKSSARFKAHRQHAGPVCPALSTSCPCGSGVTRTCYPQPPRPCSSQSAPGGPRQQRRGSGAAVPRGGGALPSGLPLSCRHRSPSSRVPWRPRAPDRDPASPSSNLSSDPTSGSETPADAGFPPADTPMVATSAAPPLPGSSRFLASRLVPELSSPGTSRRRLETASSSGQQRQPLRSLSGQRRSALFGAGVSLQPPVFAAAHNKGNM